MASNTEARDVRMVIFKEFNLPIQNLVLVRPVKSARAVQMVLSDVCVKEMLCAHSTGSYGKHRSFGF